MRIDSVLCACVYADDFSGTQFAGGVSFVKRNVAAHGIDGDLAGRCMLRNRLAGAQAQEHHAITGLVRQTFGLNLLLLNSISSLRFCFSILIFLSARCGAGFYPDPTRAPTGCAMTGLVGRAILRSAEWKRSQPCSARNYSGAWTRRNSRGLPNERWNCASEQEMLFFSGEEAKGLFVVVSGKVRAFQQNAEGREQVMHVDTAGATMADVPVFDDGPYPASAVAEEDTDVLFIDKRDILQFCLEHPPFALRALKLMAERVRRHARLVKVLSFHEVGQRLALLLLTEAQNAGVNGGERVAFQLALSNHDIAIRIGSVRDVVSRALARLQHDGLVVVKARAVTILDVRALKIYAENSH